MTAVNVEPSSCFVCGSKEGEMVAPNDCGMSVGITGPVPIVLYAYAPPPIRAL